MHNERNSEWKYNVDKTLKNTKVIYASNYAPVIILETTKTELKELASFDEVECIYSWNEEKEQTDTGVQDEQNMQESSMRTGTADYGVWQTITNIYTMRDVMGFDGEGIRIGMLEDDVPDCVEYSVLSNSDITVVYDVNVSQNAINKTKKLSVCLTWMQKVIASSLTDATMYDSYHHDLGVYDPNGNLVAYSDYHYDRKQFVYFQPSIAGTYKIKVYKTGTSQVGVATAISYNLL